ncbi:cysteine hydrolase family protein [Thermosporothrix hazakensis]|uniref:cysteine hydrolase family protein n=1 Tax=Thermosporothrix hazakensis TaxID=644383 RepID=UPI001B86D312|nr:isochorismatase family cysteine hydrolase [Thermosporothrix hazakensis]
MIADLALFDHPIITKRSPSAFHKTALEEKLREKGVDHVVICGFNTEYCALFTAIAAYDRGFKVSFIEDATGTVADANTYEMPGLDIRDFVGSVLNWSKVIDVPYFEEFKRQLAEECRGL